MVVYFNFLVRNARREITQKILLSASKISLILLKYRLRNSKLVNCRLLLIKLHLHISKLVKKLPLNPQIKIKCNIYRLIIIQKKVKISIPVSIISKLLSLASKITNILLPYSKIIFKKKYNIDLLLTI